MLLAQTGRERRETCARHSVRSLNTCMKYTLELVFIERYAMLFGQRTKWPHKHTLCDACLSAWKMAACAHAGSRI